MGSQSLSALQDYTSQVPCILTLGLSHALVDLEIE